MMVNQASCTIDGTHTKGNCNNQNLQANFQGKAILSTEGAYHKSQKNPAKVMAN